MKTTARALVAGVMTTTSLGMVGVLPAGAGASASNCPAAYEIGPLTLEQAVLLPRTQAAIAAGLTTEAEIRRFYADVIDENDNGVVCVKLPHGFEVNRAPDASLQYFFGDDLLAGTGAPRR